MILIKLMKKIGKDFEFQFYWNCSEILKILEYKGILTPLDDNEDPVWNIIEKYKNHLITFSTH